MLRAAWASYKYGAMNDELFPGLEELLEEEEEEVVEEEGRPAGRAFGEDSERYVGGIHPQMLIASTPFYLLIFSRKVSFHFWF